MHLEPLQCSTGHDRECWPWDWNRSAIFLSPHWTSHFFQLLNLREGVRRRKREEKEAHLGGAGSQFPLVLKMKLVKISCCSIFWMVNNNFVSCFPQKGRYRFLFCCFVFFSVGRYVYKLRYNSNTVKVTFLKCPVQWFSVYSHSCTTVTVYHSKIFSSPWKATLHPLAVTLHAPLLPRTVASTHRCLWICLVLDISYKQNHTICALWCLVVSCSLMLSMFTMLHHVSVLHFFLGLNNVPLDRTTVFCYPFISGWTFPLFDGFTFLIIDFHIWLYE